MQAPMKEVRFLKKRGHLAKICTNSQGKQAKDRAKGRNNDSKKQWRSAKFVEEDNPSEYGDDVERNNVTFGLYSCKLSSDKNVKDIVYTNSACEGTDFVNKVNDSDDLYQVYKIDPYKVDMMVGGSKISMELDTGASISTVGENVYYEKLNRFQLHETNVKLKSYSGDKVPIKGVIKVPVYHDDESPQMLNLIVVEGQRPCLLGRDWLKSIKLNWKQVFRINNVESVECIQKSLKVY